MKKTVLSQLDASMVKYFTELGLTEKDFWCTECGKCLVDYYLNGHIIEFNRDFWHANPKYYSANDELPRPGSTNTIAKNIWKHDTFRKKALEALGYKVMIVWETDYHNDAEKVISDCITFLGK